MSLSRQATATCDRCDNDMTVSSDDAPQAMQRAGWLTISWKPFGAADEHQDFRKWDICPKCADEFGKWR